MKGRLHPLWRLAALALAGCQSYAPEALEAERHRSAWHARTLEDASLVAFVRELEESGAGPRGGFDVADGLSLDEGRVVALLFHPDLRLARLELARARAGAREAGRWADPELELEVLRIQEDVPDHWVVAPGLAFSLPLSGRLDAARDLAGAEVSAAELRALEAEWAVWNEVAGAWADWSEARALGEENARFTGGLADLAATLARLAEAGELPGIEAELVALELGQRENEQLGVLAAAREAELRLRAVLGLAPDAPATFVPSLAADEAPALIPLDDANPTLARLRAEYEVAEHALAHAVAEQVPDLVLGPLFESDAGQTRFGLLGGWPIPLWNRGRRAIAEARADRELARAAYETTYERLAGARAAARVRAEALGEQRLALEEDLAPRADRQLAAALNLVELGESSSLVLLDSITRAHELRVRLIEVHASLARARAELQHLAGPEPERGAQER